MREIEVMEKIADLGEVFTGSEARIALNMEKGAFYHHIRRLERDGIIERIARNRYMLTFPTKTSPDSFVLAESMVPESAVAYWSALNYYGMTEQMPGKTYVITPVRRNYGRLERYGIRAVIVRENKFFGFREVRMGGRTVRITDPEKTVADGLDRPGNCGGILETVKGLSSGVDAETVAEYLRKMGSHAGMKRLGYLCGVLEIPCPDWVKEEVAKIKGYPLLDPGLERKGRWNTEWGIIVNVPEGYLEEEI